MEVPAGASPVASGPETTEDVEYCYGHPKTPTKLHCSRCDRPICGRCAIPASVGQHCPECVAEARRSAPKVRSAIAATAPVVTALLAINVGVFLLQMFTGSNVGPITRELLLDPAAIRAGEYWRLITPVFLHGGLLHIFFNCYILYSIGPNVEQAFGSVRFTLMYLAAGFLGNVASFILPPENTSLGASGAIFGIAGVLLVYLYRRRRSAFVMQYLRSIAFFIIANVVLGFTILSHVVDNYAHLGGLAAGIVLGFGFDRDDQLAPISQAIATVVVLGGGAFLVMLKL